MKFPKININWKNLGVKAMAIGGGLAAIWLAVRPKDDPVIDPDTIEDGLEPIGGELTEEEAVDDYAEDNLEETETEEEIHAEEEHV